MNLRLIIHTSLLVAIYVLAACGQNTDTADPATVTPTLVASLTSTAQTTGDVTATPETPGAVGVTETPAGPTETAVVITLDALLDEWIEPPMDITLPQGWRVAYNTLALPDVDAVRPVPLAVYEGPVTGGTGTIVLLWGFASMVAGNPLEAQIATPAPDLWADGLRLLRLAILEAGCNIGTDLRRDYRIGELAAVGTQFSAVDCPEGLPDTRGWFAGVNQGGYNFVFYVYTDPIEAMREADEELQAILDTVRFR